MMMMKPNNGQLQSPPGQKMSVYMRACQPLLCEGERTAVWLRGGKKKLKTQQRSSSCKMQRLERYVNTAEQQGGHIKKSWCMNKEYCEAGCS